MNCPWFGAEDFAILRLEVGRLICYIVHEMVESILYEKLSGARVRCGVCQRRCLISEGKMGYCHTRLNSKGRLYTLVYGEVSAQHIAPIEIKPLFHFYPNSRAFSLGTLSCNFRCIGCQNWHIAHSDPGVGRTEYVSPEESVRLARQYNCQGLSWTYNEPTIWLEYTIDGARLAKEEGLYTTYVTNGFMTPEALDRIGPYLDAFRVDIKGFRNDFYREIANVGAFKGILEVTKRAKERWEMHVEVVTNIIPGYNDDEGQLRDIARWIRDDLGEDTPWHVTRFIPHLKLSNLPPTPVETLESARQMGMEEGLRFVYLGNVPGHPGENTYCYSCGKSIIERHNWMVLSFSIEKGKCRYCGVKIPIVGHYVGVKGQHDES